ncbi:PREDICTED: odorant receptor 13a-like [Vollenhovia emeryi]|uniref:odorant receptor 13a-like n=1 Tax=Vollenhovia emeryi TaxID=411798 RepID=UPI0005F3E8E0|nr:PREDICTED: odorant receptor 13a-like [Vollenhovia emeryi]
MILMTTVSPVLRIGLGLLDVWPGVSYSIPYWLIYILSILTIQYFQYRYVFEHLEISELSNLIDSLPAALDYSLTILKLISLWMHRRVIYQLVTAMDNDWRECVGSDQHLYVMTIKANISHWCSKVMLSVNVITAAFYLLGEYAIRFVYLSGDYNDTFRQFPIKVQFPFETQQSPIFELLAVTLFLHMMLNTCTLAIVNALISTLVLHVSGQIDIMCHEFKNISKSVLHKSSANLIGMLVERHNRIILFSKNIESLFSFIALMQVVWNTLLICCLGFVIIISIHNKAGVFVIVKSATGYFAVMTEAFVICFAGEYLSLKIKLIGNAIYETMWYDMPVDQSKIIVLIIMRCQKRLTITAGKMMDMSFETFTSIIKASASYISVLNAMY